MLEMLRRIGLTQRLSRPRQVLGGLLVAGGLVAALLPGCTLITDIDRGRIASDEPDSGDPNGNQGGEGGQAQGGQAGSAGGGMPDAGPDAGMGGASGGSDAGGSAGMPTDGGADPDAGDGG
jgi:hypothetical protein